MMYFTFFLLLGTGGSQVGAGRRRSAQDGSGDVVAAQELHIAARLAELDETLDGAYAAGPAAEQAVDTGREK
jgi:hypothetical protein